MISHHQIMGKLLESRTFGKEDGIEEGILMDLVRY